MLDNGYSTRPGELDCAFKTICGTSRCFNTRTESRPTLRRQREDAHRKGQTGRQGLYDKLTSPEAARRIWEVLDIRDRILPVMR